MDENTLEMGQFMLDDFDMQGEKNLDFTKQENKLESMQTNMVNTLKEFDRMDASQNEDYANKVKDLNEEWLDYVSDFKKTHGDRLSLKPFQHIDSQLDNGAQMNDFLLGAIRDDNYIDDAEHQAWKDSWESLSLQPISVYKQKEAASNAFVLKSASKQLVENIEQYQSLDSFAKGNITMKIDDMETSWDQLDAPQQAAYLRQQTQLQKQIKNLDKNYSNKLGKSYLDEMHPDLFPTVAPPQGDPKVTDPGKKEESNIEVVKSLMQSYEGRSIKKEYEKSKRQTGGEDMTEEEFLKNRPVLVKESAEKAKASKKLGADIASFENNLKTVVNNYDDLPSDLKPEYGRKQKNKFRTEEVGGKKRKVRYTIFMGKGDGKAISRQRLDFITSKSYGSKKEQQEFKDVALRFSREVLNPYTHKWENKTIKSIDELPEGV